MSRADLIDDYLRANDPLGRRHAEQSITELRATPAVAEPAATPIAVAPRNAPQQKPSRRARPPRSRTVLVAATTVAVVGGTTAAVVGPSLFGGNGLLTPQAAVAAVAEDLSSPVILHWSATQNQTNAGVMKPLPTHMQTVVDLWNNGKTGATHLSVDSPGINKYVDDGDRLENWTDGKLTSWTAEPPTKPGPNKKTVVQKIVYPPGKPVTGWSPIDEVRRSLAAANAGRATLSDGGRWRGIPITKVTTHEPQVTVTTWIVRAHDPWLLKIASEQRARDGAPMNTTLTTTNVWKTFPVDDKTARRHLAPPTDPAKYDVKLISMFSAGSSASSSNSGSSGG